jgi:hypothetical protein
MRWKISDHVNGAMLNLFIYSFVLHPKAKDAKFQGHQSNQDMNSLLASLKRLG